MYKYDIFFYFCMTTHEFKIKTKYLFTLVFCVLFENSQIKVSTSISIGVKL